METDRVTAVVYKASLKHSIKLHQLLLMYGDHFDGCPMKVTTIGTICNCGFAKAKTTPAMHPVENYERG